MTDNDIKVVDRRWWAREDTTAAETEESGSFKPTYVEELERRLAEKDKQIQEYLTRYRAAANEFEEVRTRMRRDHLKYITLIDSSSEWTYDVNKSASRSRNSPFDGTRFRGGPVATIVNGVVVWRRDGD